MIDVKLLLIITINLIYFKQKMEVWKRNPEISDSAKVHNMSAFAMEMNELEVSMFSTSRKSKTKSSLAKTINGCKICDLPTSTGFFSVCATCKN